MNLIKSLWNPIRISSSPLKGHIEPPQESLLHPKQSQEPIRSLSFGNSSEHLQTPSTISTLITSSASSRALEISSISLHPLRPRRVLTLSRTFRTLSESLEFYGKDLLNLPKNLCYVPKNLKNLCRPSYKLLETHQNTFRHL